MWLSGLLVGMEVLGSFWGGWLSVYSSFLVERERQTDRREREGERERCVIVAQ